MKRIISAAMFLFLSFYFASAQDFDFSADTTQGCTPLKVIFLNTSDDAIKNDYNYEWVVEQGKFSNKTDSVQNTYISSGSYDVTMSVYNSSKVLVKTVKKEDFITVFEDPDVIIKSDKEFTCANKPFQFSIDTVLSDVPIVSYTWILSDGSSYSTSTPPAHTFGFAGYFDVFLSIKDSHGCTNRERKSINIKTYDDFPVVLFAASPTKTCESQLNVTFTNNTETDNIASFVWNFGDGTESSETNTQHLYNGFGTYYAKLTAISKTECEEYASRSIRLIDYQPQIGITDNISAVTFDPINALNEITKNPDTDCPCKNSSTNTKTKFCPGLITFYEENYTDNISWQWDLNNDGTIESTEKTFTTDILQGGSYNIKLTISNGTCKKDIYKTFEVEDSLVIVANPTNDFYCSLPKTVNYTAQSNIPGTTFLWHIEDTVIIGSDVYKTYRTEGIYSSTVYALSPNYCKSVVDLPNNVEITTPYISTVSSSYYAKPRSGCNPLDVDFEISYSYNTSQDSIQFISWDFQNDNTTDITDSFDEQSTEGKLSHTYTYTKDGVYSYLIYLKTNKGCSIHNRELGVYDSIRVGHKPDATIDFVNEICASNELTVDIIFNDDKERYQGIYDTISVVFSSINGISHVSKVSTPIPDSLTLQLTDTTDVHYASYMISDNGCSISGTITDSIVVNAPILFISADDAICSSPLKYMYYTEKNIGSTSLTWEIKKYDETTWIEVERDVDTIHVDFANYGGRGKYWVKCTAKNNITGCEMSDSILTQVTQIVADFNLETYEPCLYDTAQFKVSCEMGQDIASWEWLYEYKDSSYSKLFATCTIDENGNKYLNTYDYLSSKKFIYNATDITNVSVIAKDIHGCIDTVSKAVSVFQISAGFYGDIVTDCLPFTTNFTDTSKSDHTIIQRIWNLGNGTVSTDNNTSIQTEYKTEGSKQVSLTIIDDHGCRNTATISDYIKPVIPNASFYIKNPKVCLGHEATIIRNTNNKNYDNNLTHYSLDFGNGEKIESDENLKDTVFYYYSTAQKDTVRLIAYCTSPEGNECVDSSKKVIDIQDVAAKIKIKDSDLCKEPGQKFVVYLDNTYSSYIKTFEWWKKDNGDSLFISNKRSLQVVTFDNYGEQSLWLQTTSDYYGCEKTQTSIDIEVPGYEATILADKSEACVREDITFQLIDTQNISRYNSYWEFGDGQSEDFQQTITTHSYTILPTNTYNTYKVQFIVDAAGCKPRDISTIIKLYPVIADFTRGLNDTDTIGCTPFSVQLYNTSQTGTESSPSFMWYFSDGTTSTEKNPAIITLEQENLLQTISLTVTSSICNDSISKTLATYPIPSVSIDLDSSICLGETISAKASGDFASILWQPSSLFSAPNDSITNININNSQYIYAGTISNNNCRHTDSVFIFVQQKPYYYGAPDSLLLYLDSNDSLHTTSEITTNLIAGQVYNVNTTGIDGLVYSWSPNTYLSCSDCISPNINLMCGESEFLNCIDFPESIDYTITMSDTLGCFNNDTAIHFNIIIDTKVAMPEAFTPNNDGKNDLAFVRGWGIREFLEVKIYNRWGQIVFESNDITEGWDGTFNGEPQNMDTFAYTIKIINTKNEEEFIKGYITLLR